jgi:hypothetical protein
MCPRFGRNRFSLDSIEIHRGVLEYRINGLHDLFMRKRHTLVSGNDLRDGNPGAAFNEIAELRFAKR